jgi:SAM-dependent methyltransferase
VHGDVGDYAPPDFVRATETFWSLRATEIDRSTELVELGAYRGENLLRLSPFVGSALGFEADPADLEIAKSRVFGKRGLSVEAFDGADPGLEDASCDVVYFDRSRPGAILKPTAELLRVARRLLRDGGRVLILGFAATAEGRAARDTWVKRLDHVFGRATPPPDLLDEAATAGLVVDAGFKPRVERVGSALVAFEGSVPESDDADADAI